MQMGKTMWRLREKETIYNPRRERPLTTPNLPTLGCNITQIKSILLSTSFPTLQLLLASFPFFQSLQSETRESSFAHYFPSIATSFQLLKFISHALFFFIFTLPILSWDSYLFTVRLRLGPPHLLLHLGTLIFSILPVYCQINL